MVPERKTGLHITPESHAPSVAGRDGARASRPAGRETAAPGSTPLVPALQKNLLDNAQLRIGGPHQTPPRKTPGRRQMGRTQPSREPDARAAVRL